MNFAFKDLKKNLILADYATLLYLIITFLYILFNIFRLQQPGLHLAIRPLMIVFTIILVYLNNKYKNQIISLLRYFYPLLFMTYLYGETDYMNNLIFPNLDAYFIKIDQQIFGFQPSLEFSMAYPQKWFNELMNFGYFSYYLLTVLVAFVIYFYNRKFFRKSFFVICASFFIYYIIFILFPVAGPQFYFPYPESFVPDAYLFREAVKFVQMMGEAPTAAFPSSHVGISIILLFLSYRFARKLFFILTPVVVLLCFATVYIKAHYFIDILAGLVSGFILLWATLKIHNALQSRFEAKDNETENIGF